MRAPLNVIGSLATLSLLETMTNPSDPDYCCTYIPQSYCVTNPIYYFDEDGWKPKSIMVSIVIGCLYVILMTTIYNLDRSLRLSPDVWKNFHVFTLPSVFTYASISCLFITTNQCFSSVLVFYLLYGTKSSEFACYIAWFKEGLPLYGNLFLYSLVLVVVLLSVPLIFRPIWSAPMGQFCADVIAQLQLSAAFSDENLNGINSESKSDGGELKILYFDALDGLRGVMLAKGLLNQPDFSRPFHIGFADKYGSDIGSANVSERMVECSAHKLGLPPVTEVVYVEHIRDKKEEDYVKLSHVQSESYDFVVFENYLNYSRMLGTDEFWLHEMIGALDFSLEKMKHCRILNAFREIHRVLKSNGMLLIYCMKNYELGHIELIRRYLATVGFKSRCIRKIECTTVNLFGLLVNTGGPFMIIAQKEVNLEPCRIYRVAEINCDVFKVGETFDRKCIFFSSVHDGNSDSQPKVQWYDKPISYATKRTIFIVSIGICITIHVIFIVTLLFDFNELRFPKEMGMTDQFVWNLINLVINLPGNLFMVFASLYLMFGNDEDLSIGNSIKVIIVTCILGCTCSLVFSLPVWLVSVGLRYYFLYKVLKLPSSSSVNVLVTGTILIGVAVVIYRYFSNKKKVVVLPDELSGLTKIESCGIVVGCDGKGKPVVLDDVDGDENDNADRSATFSVMLGLGLG